MRNQKSEARCRSCLFAAGLLCLCLVAAGRAAVMHESYRFNRSQFETSAVDAYTVVASAEMEVTTEPGMPQLPVLPASIKLPGFCTVKAVQVVPRGWAEFRGDIVVQPSQRQVPLSVMPSGNLAASVEPDQAVYSSLQPYPAEVWQWTGTGVKNGNTVVDLLLFPVRYVGAEKSLEYCRGFDVEVEYEPSAGRSDQVVKWSSGQVGADAKYRGWQHGEFGYVIVTGSQYDSVFQRLADWKTQKGLPAVIRHMDWVIASYPGRDNAEKLRNYLKTLPDSGVKYVLLGGDVSVVPYRKAFAMNSEAGLDPREDSLPCDLYFSDLDGTWDANCNNVFGEVADSVDLYPDVVVSRAPVDSRQDAQAFVNKVLEYEQGPQEAKQTNVLFFAEEMWQNPYTDGGRHKDKLEALAFASGYTVTKKYQRLGNESRASVMAAVRSGQNYLNHDGHGWINVMSAGGSEYLRTGDADTITNSYRGIIFSIGCWTTAFDNVSIGEAFVTNPNGGTVATIGNSSYGWGSPGNPGFGYSDRYDDRFWWTIQRGGETRLGAALSQAKDYFVPLSREENVYRWHQYEVNLMGDPEMPVWTAVPETLEVSVPAEIPSGPGQVLVVVQSRGQAVDGALVCLMKGSESYGTAVTDAAGTAWLPVEAHSSGDFTLTATAKNFLPSVHAIPSGTGPYVNFAGWIVNDSLGNNDGIVNQAEQIRLPVWIHNAGDAASAGIPLKLRTSDPVVSIVDSTASAGPLPAGDSVLVWDAFEVNILTCSQDGRLLQFEVVVEDTDRPRVFRPVLLLGAPELALKSYVYTNPPALPGTDEGLTVVVDNNGHGYGHSTWARLVSLDSNVTVVAPDSILLGELAPASRSTSDSFSVSIAGACPASCLADMRLDLWCETYSFTHSFQLLVGNYGFSDDMESGTAKWTHGGTRDRWHLSGDRTHSGSAAWYSGDGATHRYVPEMNAWLMSTPFMVAENCSLKFWRWFSVPNYGVDGIYVVVMRETGADTLDFIGTGGALGKKPEVRSQNSEFRSPEAGAQLLESLNPRSLDPLPFGIESDWFEEKYDLSALVVGETVQVKIGFKSDADTMVGEGFYIDDLVVSGGGLPPAFVQEENGGWGIENRTAVLTAYPNPFSNSVVLHIAYGVERNASFRVFDASGRCVRNLAGGCQPSAVSSFTWDGLDDSGRRVPAGPYFIEARSSSGVQLARVILAK